MNCGILHGDIWRSGALKSTSTFSHFLLAQVMLCFGRKTSTVADAGSAFAQVIHPLMIRGLGGQRPVGAALPHKATLNAGLAHYLSRSDPPSLNRPPWRCQYR
jgi:hypothetical protein